MEKKKSSFSAISEILGQRVIGGKAAPALSLLDLVRRWPEIVGKRIADQAGPVRLRNGVLTVQVRSPVWAQELQVMTPRLLSEIQQGCPPIEDREAEVCFVTVGAYGVRPQIAIGEEGRKPCTPTQH